MNKSLSLIGIGSFGEFILKYLVPYFEVKITDSERDLNEIAKIYDLKICSLKEAAKSDIVLLAVPAKAIESIVQQLNFKAGQLVIDVASVQCLPAKILSENTSSDVDIISLHPLFGPRSGKDGIEGQNIVISNIRGERGDEVVRFLTEKLRLNVISSTPEAHDQQMAYSQLVTHMFAKIYKAMDIPVITQKTKSFSLLSEMAEIAGNTGEDIFKSILTDNPYADHAKQKFFDSVKELEKMLKN